MKYEYDRIVVEFKRTSELLDEIDKFAADGWEIISYKETKPEKFGEKFESIVLFKRKKPCNQEKT